MTDGEGPRRSRRGELVGAAIFMLVLFSIGAVIAYWGYSIPRGDMYRWTTTIVGAVLVVVGVLLSRNCILGLMGVMMTVVGAGFVVGNVVAWLAPRAA